MSREIFGATSKAILPTKPQMWYLQHLEINALKFSGTYQVKLQLYWGPQEEHFLVDKKSNSVQWEVPNFTTTRCLNRDSFVEGETK